LYTTLTASHTSSQFTLREATLYDSSTLTHMKADKFHIATSIAHYIFKAVMKHDYFILAAQW